MSRIGKKPVTLPKGVKVTVIGSEAVVEGAKGKLSCPIPAGIALDLACRHSPPSTTMPNTLSTSETAEIRAPSGRTR